MPFTDRLFLCYFLPLSVLLHRITVKSGTGYSTFSRLVFFGLTLYFYGKENPVWLLPFGLTIFFDFLWGALLTKTENSRSRKIILVVSVTQNVLLLAFYKYQIPFPTLSLASIALPAGISFYTFESLSYVFDIYRKEIIPPKNPLHFFSFIGMFPRFIAGPIVRYKDIQTQCENYRGPDIERGILYFTFGLFLKVCFANSFAVFSSFLVPFVPPVHWVNAWAGLLSYHLQIYFDFWGYSVMAIGLGYCFGFTYPKNFDKPYHAKSLRDFWRRWHISLSTWLRDYVYIPLGGGKAGHLRTLRNIFITMLIGGIWHGNNLTFLVWGAWHGGWLCFERIFHTPLKSRPLFHKTFSQLVVLLGWIPFASNNLRNAFNFTKCLIPGENLKHFNPVLFDLEIPALTLCFVGILFLLFIEPSDYERKIEMVLESFRLKILAFCTLFLSILLLASRMGVPFLYFKF